MGIIEDFNERHGGDIDRPWTPQDKEDVQLFNVSGYGNVPEKNRLRFERWLRNKTGETADRRIILNGS